MMWIQVVAVCAGLMGPGNDESVFADLVGFQDGAKEDFGVPWEMPAPPADQEDFPGGTVPSPACENLLVDFERLTLTPRLGMLVFSDDFEADPSVSFGILARAPMPWFSQDVMGLETNDFGAFAEITLSSIDRDITPKPSSPDGAIFFLGVGIDYVLGRDETSFLVAQLELQYGSYGGVSGLDDGVALLPGIMGGIDLGNGFSITYDAQLAFADAGDHIFFNQVGLLFRF